MFGLVPGATLRNSCFFGQILLKRYFLFLFLSRSCADQILPVLLCHYRNRQTQEVAISFKLIKPFFFFFVSIGIHPMQG